MAEDPTIELAVEGVLAALQRKAEDEPWGGPAPPKSWVLVIGALTSRHRPRQFATLKNILVAAIQRGPVQLSTVRLAPLDTQRVEQTTFLDESLLSGPLPLDYHDPWDLARSGNYRVLVLRRIQ